MANLQHRSVRREERGMFILHQFLTDVYALFLTLVSDGKCLILVSREIPGPFLLKSDVNLFNHLVRKADVAGCCSAVLFFVDMRLPRIQCR